MATWGMGANFGNIEGNMEGNWEGNWEGNLVGNLEGKLEGNFGREFWVPLQIVNLGGHIVELQFGGGLYMGPIVSLTQDILTITKIFLGKNYFLGE